MNEPTLPLWEIVQTSHVVARHFRELFARHDLTPTQFGVLACLGDGDDFTKAQLARAVLVTPQSMDPLIDSLLARGLVDRDGEPRRGRAAGIRITASGTRLLNQVRPDVVHLNNAARIGLGDDEADRLVSALRTIRNTLGQGPAIVDSP